ncbi:MAG: GFA family protein, partial [Hyphomicrobiales bacterium]
MSDTLRGKCFCGTVEIAATGQPKVMGFCHCSSCRSWAAAPVNAFTLWDPEAVTVTKGKDRLGTYHKTESSYRQFCQQCGGHIMTDHPAIGLIDVYAAVLPDLA